MLLTRSADPGMARAWPADMVVTDYTTRSASFEKVE
jgi:hypothetical protein